MRDNFQSSIPENLVPYKLPDNWTWFFWSDLMESYQQGMIRSNRQLGKGNVFYLKMGDLDDKGSADLTNLAVADASEKEITDFKLTKGDFLINVRNSRELVGKTCVIGNVDTIVLYNHMLVRIDNGSLEMNYFINAFLNIPSSKKLLDRIKQGTTTVIALYQRDLNQLPIPLPDTLTFNAIVSLYKNIDSKIELNNQINQQLEEMAKIIYDYWFVQFDFPNEEGKPYKSSGGKMVYNKQLRREIPEGWEVKELSDIVKVSNETLNPMLTPNKGFKHYSIPVFDVTGTYAVERGDEIKSNKFVVNANDILVSKLNPWFNRVVYVENEDDMISSTEFVVWRTDDVAMKNYLYMVARNEHFIETNVQAATGTSNSHRRVNPTLMMKYKVPFSSKQVHDFNAIIESSIKKTIELKKENQQLALLRDWLLPMLMNGQVRVEEERRV